MNKTILVAVVALGLLTVPVYTTAATTHLVLKHGNVSPLLDNALDLGNAAPTQEMRIVWSLDLRNRAALDQFLADVQDPASPVFHQFLASADFNALYAPTAAQEAQVVDFLSASGFTVTQTFSNHLLVEAKAPVSVVESTFGVDVHAFLYDGEVYLAAVNDPSVPEGLASFTVGILGLGDVGVVHPMSHAKLVLTPNDNLGTNCCYFSPRDLNVAYNEDHLVSHTGSGQTIVIVGAYDFQTSDFTAFNTQMGLSNPTVTRVCAGSGSGCAYNSQNSIEIALDIEYSHGTAPSAALVSVMAQTTLLTDFTTAYNNVVSGNYGHSVSTSWGLCEQSMASSTRTSDDNIFASGAALGQSWFAASGDSGSKDCNHRTGVDYPASSPNMMGVGGTHLTCSGGMTPSQPVCTGYGSESGWSGSGGGNSIYYSKPSWQTCASGTARAVPDISLEADTTPGNLVASGGSWYAVGGTSDAAPQLAGMFAALNAAKGTQGNPGARFNALCGGNTFHDVTSGSNGGFSAVAGYDRVTGIGTINEGNLITNW